jgi:hypothetical protein
MSVLSLAERVERDFTYRPPKGDQQSRCVTLRDQAKQLAFLIIELTPVSREQSVALTHLDEVVMFASAAIARNE